MNGSVLVPRRRPHRHLIEVAGSPTAALMTIQLVGAALALAAWLLIGATESAGTERPVIDAYAYGAVASLVATLGIPFLIPNLFRGIETRRPPTTGPWSVPLWINTAVPALCLLASVARGAATTSDDPLALTLAYTGGVAAGVTVLQLARIRVSRLLMCAGMLPQVLFPAAWLLGISVFHSRSSAGAIATCCQGAAWIVCYWSVRRIIGGLAAATRASHESLGFILKSAQLLPHLLAFAVLGQGPRLIASLFAGSQLQATAHSSMLVVSAASTFLASLNAIWSVGAQMTPDSAVRHASVRLSLRYGLVGAGLAVFCWSGIEIGKALGVLQGGSLSAAFAAALSSSLVGFAGYYSVSAFVLRSNRAWILPATSGACALLYVGTGALQVAHGNAVWMGYALAAGLLPIASTSLAAIFLRDMDVDWRAAILRTSSAYLPIAAVAMASALVG